MADRRAELQLPAVKSPRWGVEAVVAVEVGIWGLVLAFQGCILQCIEEFEALAWAIRNRIHTVIEMDRERQHL